MCTSPRHVYRGPSGIAWKPKESWDDKVRTMLPCGNCDECAGRAKTDKAIRVIHTLQTHPLGVGKFVTLTYDPKNLPRDGLLQIADLQHFMKRLRHKCPEGLQYLAAGEYGSEAKGFRPHYHLCLIGYASEADGTRDIVLEDAWGHGLTHSGELTFASAMYTAKYTQKKVELDKLYQPGHPSYPIHFTKAPEFSVSSKNPALGKTFIEKYWQDIYGSGFDQVVVNDWTHSPPRYYDKWLEKNEPYTWMNVMRKRASRRHKQKMEWREQQNDDARRAENRRRKQQTREQNKL